MTVFIPSRLIAFRNDPERMILLYNKNGMTEHVFTNAEPHPLMDGYLAECGSIPPYFQNVIFEHAPE